MVLAAPKTDFHPVTGFVRIVGLVTLLVNSLCYEINRGFVDYCMAWRIVELFSGDPRFVW